MSVWVVLPTYDEAANIARAVSALRAALERAAPEGFRILVVDDDSPDGTGVIADWLAAAHPGQVEVLHRSTKAGIGPAYVAGFRRALEQGATFVLEMDADLSHDAADVPRLLDRARAGADVVLGSRYVPGGGTRNWGLARRILSRAGSAYARTVLGLDVRDLTGGFKCFRAAALRAIDPGALHARGYAFQIEATYRAVRLGLEVIEVPIVFSDRVAGRSKLTPAIAREAAWRPFALRFGAAMRAPQPAGGEATAAAPFRY